MTEERKGDGRPDGDEEQRHDDAVSRAESVPEPAAGSDETGAQATDAAPLSPSGLRSAASIYGEARLPDNWPTRRARREAERAAARTGQVLPGPAASVTPTGEAGSVAQTVPATPAEPREPTVPVAQAAPPAPSEHAEPEAPAEPKLPAGPDVSAGPGESVPIVPPESVERPAPVVAAEPAESGISVPPAAAEPPTSSAPHPLSIDLPFVRSSREERAAEAHDIDAERRRVDPDGEGRDDVDWLGRATAPTATRTPAGEDAPKTSGVRDGFATGANEPPSFTDLLRVDPSTSDDRSDARPFNWAVVDDTDSEDVPESDVVDDADADFIDDSSAAPVAGTDSTAVQEDLTAHHADGVIDTHRRDALSVATVAMTTIDVGDSDDVDDSDLDSTDDQVDVPALPVSASLPDSADAVALNPRTEPAPLVDPDQVTPAGSWSLSEEAARTGEVFPGNLLGPTLASADRPEVDDAELLPRSAAAERVPGESAASGGASTPLVNPPTRSAASSANGQVPRNVENDLDAVLGIGVHADQPQPNTAGVDPVAELDQSEWDGRETSDTRAIDALFGTGALRPVDVTDESDDPGSIGQVTRAVPAAETGARGADRFPEVLRPVSQQAPGARRPIVNPQDAQHDNLVQAGFGRLQAEGRRGKRWLIVGAIVIIVVMLVAVFFLAQWVRAGSVDGQPTQSTTPSAAAKATSHPTRSPAARQANTVSFATTTAAAGVHSWRALAGGECLADLTDVWAEQFTVVDCATEHPAQLTYRGTLTATAYPGADQLATQTAAACNSATAINLAAAASYSDLQVQGSYPATAADWEAGNHYFSCFVSRSGDGALVGSLTPTA